MESETIHFDDYNAGELMKIFAINAKNFILGEEYKDKLINVFGKLPTLAAV